MAVFVALALIAIGLWSLARAEPPPATASSDAASSDAASSDAASSDAAPRHSLPAPPEEDGTTLAAELAPAERAAALITGEFQVDLPTEEREDPTGPVPLIVLSAVGRSDPGRRRPHNEDAVVVSDEHGLYAVADGMGGYAAGEVASQLAVDTLAHAFTTGEFGGAPIEGLPRRGDELVRAIQTANAAILAQARANEAQAGMGTTVVAARFSSHRQRVYIAHVGDSRAYRLRRDELTQLTADHTLGAAGMTGPSASKLSRAVGVFDEVEVDLQIDEPLAGDVYLLCSDGLSKMVPAAEIQRIVCEERQLSALADRLIAEANARGGRDNVSVIVVRVDAPGAES